LTTGLYTSNAIMAALIARGRTERGQHIDASLSDCQVATLTNLASSTLISGEKDSGRWGTEHRRSSLLSRDGEYLCLLGQPQSYHIEVTKPKTETFFSVGEMTSYLECSAINSVILNGRQIVASFPIAGGLGIVALLII
jgi:hypothetical protein